MNSKEQNAYDHGQDWAAAVFFGEIAKGDMSWARGMFTTDYSFFDKGYNDFMTSQRVK